VRQVITRCATAWRRSSPLPLLLRCYAGGAGEGGVVEVGEGEGDAGEKVMRLMGGGKREGRT
jgi:hypothetical protein